MATDDSGESANPRGLERGLGLWQATSLNIANMVGIGPFITIPTFVAAMQGPQALLAWVAAALLVLCDGLVWSELGAALPGSGGTYHFLREIFGKYRWGRVLPFLFIWQFLVSGALEVASAGIGARDYFYYAFPGLKEALPAGDKWLAAGAILVVVLLLCQRIGNLGWMSLVLCAGTIVTVLTVIIVGLWNFNPELLRVDPGAWDFSSREKVGTFSSGLAAAMLIAIYDYLGYYNVCHLGDEVRDPGRTIPRAVMISVVFVAAVYLTMNTAILGVIPWQEVKESNVVGSLVIERTYGVVAARWFTLLILWTVFACLFAIMLGYSRIPYAAARNGDFFRIFAKLHETKAYPVVSLWVFGSLTAAFSFLDLSTVINGAVLVRILVQFIGQIVGLHLLRRRWPPEKFPFRMWLYPLPSLIALMGWLFVFCMGDRMVLLASAGVMASGVVACMVWQRWGRHEGAGARD